MYSWYRKSPRDKIADKIDELWGQDQIYESGYWTGYHAAMLHEHETRAWIRGGPKPSTPYLANPRSKYKRLMKHYLKLWRRERE